MLFGSYLSFPVLQEIGLFHLGDQVNQFQKGSLVMQNNDNPAFREIQTIIFGTITGSIGVVASLPAEIYSQIADVEVNAKTSTVHSDLPCLLAFNLNPFVAQ